MSKMPLSSEPRDDELDGEETELCLINTKTKLPVVVIDDAGGDSVKVIATDGRILLLERALFDDDSIELLMNRLNQKQQEKLSSIRRKIEADALATVRAVEDEVAYEATRLTFLAKIIEPLKAGERFTVICRDGHFTMTKDQFYSTFANVANSDSYQLNGTYNYHTTPSKAFFYCTSRRGGA